MSNIKPVIQRDLKDCGVCAMAWIINYYDGYVPVEKLREDTLTDRNGTNAYQIVHAFNKWGFDSKGVLEHNLYSNELIFPLIAHIHLPNNLEHFVVVRNIIKDTVYLMDPSVGYKKIKVEEFQKLFTGNIIIAYPREKIIKMDKGINIKELFYKILIKEKHLVFKIILSSIIWTLLLIICSYYLKIGGNLLVQDKNILKYLIICFGIFTIMKVIFLYIRDYYENHLRNIVDVLIYPDFIRHLFFLPLKSISTRSTGEIVTRIEELGNIKELFSNIFVSLFLDSVMVLISTIFLYIINSKLLLILLIIVFVYIIWGIIVSNIMYKKILENINYQTDFNSEIVEDINMFESIKNLNMPNKFLRRIEIKLSQYLLNNYEFSNFINNTNFFKNILLEVSVFIINSWGFYLIIHGELSLVDLFTFNIIASYFLDPVKNIINILPKYNYVKASFAKISEFLTIEEEKISSSHMVLKGDIKIKNVNYSYNNYDYILKDCNIDIKRGSHVLLSGKSGSGKSTLCKLLYKENELITGDIFIDNYHINDLDLNIIRNNIIYVSQNEKLITGSIKDNIILGRDISMDRFYKICKICRIEEIIRKRKMRYEAIIDSATNNLSGGERQRIILARGLLKNSNIIILDEALSEVDYKTEAMIIKNIRNYYQNKTIIYISHKNQKSSFENIINVGDSNELLAY